MLAHGLRLTSHLLNEDVMLHVESASEFVSIKKDAHKPKGLHRPCHVGVELVYGEYSAECVTRGHKCDTAATLLVYTSLCCCTYCAYPRRDGQAELAWVVWLYTWPVAHRNINRTRLYSNWRCEKTERNRKCWCLFPSLTD